MLSSINALELSPLTLLAFISGVVTLAAMLSPMCMVVRSLLSVPTGSKSLPVFVIR